MAYLRSTEVRKEINYKTTFRNGGFIFYWKLYFNFIPVYHTAVKDFPILNKLWAWITFIFKTFWWLLIKPFGTVYKRKRIMKGKVIIIDGTLLFKNSTVKKTNIHYLFLIPVFAHPWYMVEKDWDDILK